MKIGKIHLSIYVVMRKKLSCRVSPSFMSIIQVFYIEINKYFKSNCEMHVFWSGYTLCIFAFGKYPKSVLSRPLHPPKVKIIWNQSFQDHHIIPKWKMLKISPFKAATYSLSTNCWKSFLSIQPLSQSENYQESVLSWPSHWLDELWPWISQLKPYVVSTHISWPYYLPF